uniref:Fungal lipase-type domain-containing protein n=1 Tax=Kalanchoe fedtschenkoi TaxID=63787 RepID=A0A7N0SXJ4_KALFE
MAQDDKFRLGEIPRSDYFIVHADQATVFDLARLLTSKNVKRLRFIDCGEGIWFRNYSFKRRWIIFVSVVAQKVFLLLKWPSKLIGFWIEWWLNLFRINGGLLQFCIKILTGRSLKCPNKHSPDFVTLIGNLDHRVELRKSRYPSVSHLCVMASKIAYENQAFVHKIVTKKWKMVHLAFHNFYNAYTKDYTTQAFICYNKKAHPSKLIAVTFRGTSPFDADDWRTDIDLSWYEFQHIGKVHAGFLNSLGFPGTDSWPKHIDPDHPLSSSAYYTIREKLRDNLKRDEGAKFILTGHSMGGALAVLFAALLVIHEDEWMLERLEGVYTFGQPRVGDWRFGEYMNHKMMSLGVKYWRYVYCNDMVSRIPCDDKSLFFRHFGQCFYYNSLYQGKEMEEAPNKNYFSPVCFIPMFLNAIWELVRGFILPCWKGCEYKEGWFMVLYRMSGLILPGFSSHSARDYINSVRLSHHEAN